MNQQPGSLKVEFNSRLGDDWSDLCNLLEMSRVHREKLSPGERGSGIWDWLESRGILHDLPGALREVDRDDLAELLEDNAPRLFKKQQRPAELELTWQDIPFPATKLPRTGEHLVGRDIELERLDEAWFSDNARIVQIVAPGGVGKTQLVKKWRESLLDRDERAGAVRAFDWSFYSQGTGQQSSADDFFDKALRWFGEPDPLRCSSFKGERLAQLIQEQRTLLILDGLEPLQHPPGPLRGDLTDPALQALIRSLGESNPGLCVVTTRERVTDISEMSSSRQQTIDLNTLLPSFGAQLLTEFGVNGDESELRAASREVDGHALALILLGTFLKDHCDGDVSRRNEVLLFDGAERFADHAHKVMASYVKWFEGEDATGRAAASILHLLGLFNRPADEGCLEALRAEPPIPGLTEALFQGDPNDLWRKAVKRLRASRLLTDVVPPSQTTSIGSTDSSEALDAHPLIREYFARQLTEKFPDAAKEAHRRLYEHLKNAAPELPESLSEMMPLFHAIRHGCAAGQTLDAHDNVYWPRIQRDFRANYCIRQLGAVGAELSALACFFKSGWDTPHPDLDARRQAILLGNAAFRLRAMNRNGDSVKPAEHAVSAMVDLEEWDQAAIAASNLSELLLTLGDIASAVRLGEQSVELAEHSGDSFHRMARRTTLAAALHAAGVPDSDDTEIALLPKRAFDDAESIQQERQPEYSVLYSLRGYQFCELLLDELNQYSLLNNPASEELDSVLSRIKKIRERAAQTLEISINNAVSLLDQGLNNISLGRTWSLEFVVRNGAGADSDSSILASARTHLDRGVNLLR